MAENDNNPDDNTDEGTEDTRGQGGDEGTEDDEDGTEEYRAPAKEEWTKTQRTLARIKSERTNLRRELAALRAKSGKSEDTKDKDETKDDAPKADPDERAKRVAVVSTLRGTGMTREQAVKVAKLVDLDEVSIDGDEVDAEDAIEELRSQFPALFGTPEPVASTRRPRASGGRDRSSGSGQSADEKHTAGLLRAAGYK